MTASLKALQRQTETEATSFEAEVKTGDDGSVHLGENFQYDLTALGMVGSSAVAPVGCSGASGFWATLQVYNISIIYIYIYM